MPDVGGQTSEDATQALEEAGFEVKEETGESSESYEGYVTEQDPRGGRNAEVGSTVTITVGGGPESVEVPDLYNRTVEEARRPWKRPTSRSAARRGRLAARYRRARSSPRTHPRAATPSPVAP